MAYNYSNSKEYLAATDLANPIKRTPSYWSNFTKSYMNDLAKAEKERLKREEEARKKKQTDTGAQNTALQKEIDNAKTRLSDAGVNVKKATDNRGVFEKAFNLKQGNFLQNALEFVGRPMQAAFTADKAYEQGKGIGDIAKGAYNGFTGHAHTSGKDLLKAAGADFNNPEVMKIAEATPLIGSLLKNLAGNDKAKEKRYFENTMGTSLEVAGDPTNLVPGKVIAAPIVGGGKLLSKGASAVGKLGKDGSAFKEGMTATKDLLGEAFNPNKYTDPAIKEYFQNIEAGKNGLQEKNFKILNELAKNTGLEKGSDVAKVLEKDLKTTMTPDDLMTRLNGMSVNDQMLIRGNDKSGGLGKDFTSLKNLINTATVESPKFQKTIQAKMAQQDKSQAIIKGIADNHNGLDTLGTKINEFDKSAFKLAEQSGKGAEGFVPFTRLIAENDQISTVFTLAKDSMKAMKDNLTPEEYKAFKGTLSDAMKAKNAMSKAKTLKNQQTDMSIPIKVEKLAGANKYTDLTGEAKTAAVTMSQERKALQDELPRLEDQLTELQHTNIHTQTANFDKAIKAKETEIQLAKDKMMELDNNINKLVTDGTQQGYKVTKTDKAAMSKTIMNNGDNIIANHLTNTGKLDNSTVLNPNVDKGVKPLTDKQKLTTARENAKIELPRLARTLSSDPKVHQAADRITGMFDELRKFASDNKIDIPNNDGYITHVITDEYKKLTAKAQPSSGQAAMGGNAKVVGKRQLIGSIADVNEAAGKGVFHDNAYKAFADGYKRVSNYVAAEGFVKHVLNTSAQKVSFEDKVKWIDSKGKSNLPKGKVLVKASDFKFYQVLDKEGASHLAVKPSDEFLIDKGTHNLMKRYDYLTSENGIEKFFTGFDKHMKFWKGMQLMSLGYHARNAIGADFNRYVAGMNMSDMVYHDAQAVKELRQYDKSIIPKVTKGEDLTPKEKEIYGRVNQYLTSGLRDSSRYRNEFNQFDRTFTKLEEKLGTKEKVKTSPLQKVGNAAVGTFNKLTDANFHLGTSIDDIKRYGMYQWAKANPEKIAKTAGIKDNAAMKVKEAMFDYQDLTPLERTVLKRVMPFYTFTRKNLPFQMQKLALHPQKYANVNKIIQGSYAAGGYDDQQIPDYLKNSYAVGNPLAKNELLKTYLPMADLNNYTTPLNAAKQITSMLTPMLKLPIEVGSNFDTFRNQPIEKFKGEKTDKYGGAVSPMVAHVLDQLGLRNIDKGVTSAKAAYSDITNKKMATDSKTQSWREKYIPSLYTDFNPEKVKNSKLYNERKVVQDLLQKAKQDGKPVRTINEIKKEQKNLQNYFGF